MSLEKHTLEEAKIDIQRFYSGLREEIFKACKLRI